MKKRKDHYKGEFNPATLLKKKVNEEDEEELWWFELQMIFQDMQIKSLKRFL